MPVTGVGSYSREGLLPAMALREHLVVETGCWVRWTLRLDPVGALLSHDRLGPCSEKVNPRAPNSETKERTSPACAIPVMEFTLLEPGC